LSEAIMRAWQIPSILCLALAASVTLAACAGGSGSSGFDISPSREDRAIEVALEEQRCVDLEGFRICPAETTATERPVESPTATPTPTVMPTSPAGETASPSPTRNALETPSPTVPANTETPPAPSPTPTPSPTRTIVAAPGVDLTLNQSGAVDCADVGQDGICHLQILFAPFGFSPDTQFRVAVRELDRATLEPIGDWLIGEAPVLVSTSGTPVFAAGLSAVPASEAAAGKALVQFAVLVFLHPPATIPETIELLGESGADSAFVTAEITIETGTGLS